MDLRDGFSGRAAPGAARGAPGPEPKDTADLTGRVAEALEILPTAERAAVVGHVEELARMSPVRRAAILTLTEPEGPA
jgi:hypothetical protein